MTSLSKTDGTRSYFSFDWFERDCSALEFTYTVSGKLGVEGAVADPAATYTVYNLMGVKLLENADGEAVSRLPKGIYIINGKKKSI